MFFLLTVLPKQYVKTSILNHINVITNLHLFLQETSVNKINTTQIHILYNIVLYYIYYKVAKLISEYTILQIYLMQMYLLKVHITTFVFYCIYHKFLIYKYTTFICVFFLYN